MLDVLSGKVVYTPPVANPSRFPKVLTDYWRSITSTTPAQPSGTRSDLGAVLSPSQVKLFLFDCSAKWWFKYGMGLPDKPGGSRVRGLAVHKTVEFYFRLRKDRHGSPVSSEEMAPAYDLAWEQAEADASFSTGDDIPKLKSQGAQLTKKYLDEVAPEIEPSEMEMPVSGEIRGVKVRGRIDLLDTRGRIIDLKTAGTKPSGADPGYTFQLATYHQLAGHRSCGMSRLDTLVATKTPQLVTIEHRVNAADLTLTQKLYPLAQEGMKEGLYYPNRSGRTCSRKYCNFADACMKEFGGTVE